MTAEKMMAQLQLYADDPMWADHAEVPKRLLHEAIAVIRASAVGAGGEKSAVMKAAEKAQERVDGWSDAKRDYAERVTTIPVRPEAPAGQHSGAWRPITRHEAELLQARGNRPGERVDWIEGAGYVVYDDQAAAETREQIALPSDPVEPGLLDRIIDAEIALHTWDPTRASEYWLRHPDPVRRSTQQGGDK